MSHMLLFLFVFVAMEWAAWALHKYVMHGFLWSLHQDHHVIDKSRWWQKNDAFAILFAVPSFLLILFGTYFVDSHFATVGYGIMAYGAAYFFVHEVVIHRRLKFIRLRGIRYFDGVVAAHKDHHKVRFQHGSGNFGMLVVPFKYFRDSKDVLE